MAHDIDIILYHYELHSLSRSLEVVIEHFWSGYLSRETIKPKSWKDFQMSWMINSFICNKIALLSHYELCRENVFMLRQPNHSSESKVSCQKSTSSEPFWGLSSVDSSSVLESALILSHAPEICQKFYYREWCYLLEPLLLDCFPLASSQDVAGRICLCSFKINGSLTSSLYSSS